MLNTLIENAKKSGAQSSEEFEEENSTFSGTGYRLGSQTSKSNTVNPAKKEQEKRVKLILWKNGFTFGDGSLRDYNDPASKSFLDSIQRGLLPRELQNLGDDFLVDLIDQRGEDYKEAPKVLQPFSGNGQRLGSATPSTNTISTPTTSSKPFEVNESEPITSIQIRCSDGSRLVGKFNHSHTVKDIRRYIDSIKPTKSAYELCFSFPQKPIADETVTVVAANLLNSVVVQKMK